MFSNLTRRVLIPQAVGLDISDLTIKFCRVVPTKHATAVEYFGEIEIPEGIVVGGEIVKEAELSEILRTKLITSRGRKIRERYCVASLPEEKSFVRVLEIPNVKLEDVEHAVRWEVEGAVPLPFEEIFYDYELTPRLPSSADHRDVLITAFPRNIIHSYHRVLTEAGFTVLGLELESQAISRAIMSRERLSQAVIIVDIGTTRTSFIIFAGGSLIFTKSVTIGGHDFDGAIAAAFRIPVDQARAIKIEAGLNKNYHNGEAFLALAPLLTALTDELKQQLWFYRDHPAKRHKAMGDIEAIILCGGDANLIGLEKYIAITIKKPTVLGDPFTNLRLPPHTIPPIPKNLSLKYTTALGLALRAGGL